jgi:hypothetical protein
MTFSYELGRPSLHFVKNHPAPTICTKPPMPRPRKTRLVRSGPSWPTHPIWLLRLAGERLQGGSHCRNTRLFPVPGRSWHTPLPVARRQTAFESVERSLPRSPGEPPTTIYGPAAQSKLLPTMQTSPPTYSAGLENRPVNLFSDLMRHHTGASLASAPCLAHNDAGPRPRRP